MIANSFGWRGRTRWGGWSVLACTIAVSACGAETAEPDKPAEPPGQSDDAVVQAPEPRLATPEEAARVEAALSQSSTPHHPHRPLNDAEFAALLGGFESASTPRDRQDALVRYFNAMKDLDREQQERRKRELLEVQAKLLSSGKGG